MAFWRQAWNTARDIQQTQALLDSGARVITEWDALLAIKKVPVRRSTREIDLAPDALLQMTAQIKSILPELSLSSGVKFVGALVGNIGRQQGQFFQFVVQLPDDHQHAVLAEGMALTLVVQALSPRATTCGKAASVS